MIIIAHWSAQISVRIRKYMAGVMSFPNGVVSSALLHKQLLSMVVSGVQMLLILLLGKHLLQEGRH